MIVKKRIRHKTRPGSKTSGKGALRHLWRQATNMLESLEIILRLIYPLMEVDIMIHLVSFVAYNPWPITNQLILFPLCPYAKYAVLKKRYWNTKKINSAITDAATVKPCLFRRLRQ